MTGILNVKGPTLQRGTKNGQGKIDWVGGAKTVIKLAAMVSYFEMIR